MGETSLARARPLSRLGSLAFAAISLPVSAVTLALAVYLPRHYASHLGLNLALVGSAFFLVRTIDIPIDGLLGWAMDRTRTRFGRYRPWLLAGVPVLMAGLYLLFLAPPGVGRGYLVAALLVTYLGLSILTLSSIAWAASLAPSYADRSRLFGVISGIGVLGSAAVIAIPIVRGARHLADSGAVPAMGLFVLALAPLAALVSTARTPERLAPDSGEAHFKLRDFGGLVARPSFLRILLADLCLALGPGWMAASYLFFFTDSRGFSTAQASLLLAVYIVAGVVGAPVMAQLANRISKHRAVMVAAGGYAVVILGFLIIPHGDMRVGGVLLFIAGVLAAGFNVLTRAMTADVADEVRLEQGRERAGLLYAVTTMTQKIAGALSIGLTFFVLSRVGYNAAEGAMNSAEAIRHLEMVFLAGPVLFVTLGAVCMIGYALDAERHAEIRARLAERDGLETPYSETAAVVELPLTMLSLERRRRRR